MVPRLHGMKRTLVSLAILLSIGASAPMASAKPAPKPNPCLLSPAQNVAKSYHGCNFVKLGSSAPSFTKLHPW